MARSVAEDTGTGAAQVNVLDQVRRAESRARLMPLIAGGAPSRPESEPTGVTQPLRSKGGGFAAGTLNHLAGPTPAEEWEALVAEEAKLMERLQKIVADRARLELHMALAGTAIMRSVETTGMGRATDAR